MRIGYDAKRIFHNASGLGNYGRDLVRNLAISFPKTEFYLYNPKKPSVNRWRSLPNTKTRKPAGIWRYFHAIWRQGPISRQLKADQIDLYHGLSGELPKGLKTASVVTVHDLIFMRYPKLYKAADVYIHKRKVNHAVSAATKVVTISEQTKADLLEFTTVTEDKVSVIYQGCHRVFKNKLNEKEKEEIRVKYGLPDTFVLYVGTLEKRKNALSIAKALKDSALHMVFIGKVKAHGEKIKAFVAENKMQNRVIFIEGIGLDDLAGVYQNATVFCYPSFFEGFGIPIIEALYSGVPVITTKGGCFSEAGGPASLYVDPKDEKELQQAINKLFSESEERRSLRIKEGISYVQKFNDDVIVAQWEKLYQSVKHG